MSTLCAATWCWFVRGYHSADCEPLCAYPNDTSRLPHYVHSTHSELLLIRSAGKLERPTCSPTTPTPGVSSKCILRQHHTRVAYPMTPRVPAPTPELTPPPTLAAALAGRPVQTSAPTSHIPGISLRVSAQTPALLSSDGATTL